MRPAVTAALAHAAAFGVTGASGCAVPRTAPVVRAPGYQVLAHTASADRSAFWDDLAAADVVYVGESHDDRWHHQFQLEVLRHMREARGGRLLLGMEMFQWPYQEPLDDYVAGRIDENEMLRRTEYFTRWSFDHTLYAPLWRYCRANGIGIVALNAPRDVTRKIGREGMESLTEEERALIADEIDLGVAAHRERILGIFKGGAHPMPDDRLEKLYQAMTVWDETMAESAARALAEAGDGARMLVIAGLHHVQGRDGIPMRTERRLQSGIHVVIVLRTDGGGEVDMPGPELAHYVVVLTDTKPKLGVRFARDHEGPGALIESVTAGGPAGHAGLAAGDVIRSFRGRVVRDLTDVLYVLDTMRMGDEVPVRYGRDGALHETTLRLFPLPRPKPRPKADAKE